MQSNNRNIGEELISVIVPVYNVKNYVGKCVESIIHQTYNNLEILLVDDGSTDGSDVICEEYAKKDDRIKVFHKKNGGLSSARNLGLKHAKGKYIGFVDSDDFIEKDMYELLVQNMASDVDITCCGRVILYPESMKKRPECRYALESSVKLENVNALRELFLRRKCSFSVCTKLFRKEVICGNKFLYGRICEDIPFTYEAFRKSRNIVHIGKAKYINFCRENSISRSVFHLGRMDYVLFARDILLDVYKNCPVLKLEATCLYIVNIYNTIRNIEECGMQQKYKDILYILKKEFVCMYIRNLHNPYLSKSMQALLKEIIINR